MENKEKNECDEITEGNKISYDDFAKIELRTAKIISADRVEESDKLVRLLLSLGKEERQILAGIGKIYTPEELVGKIIVMVANLQPRRMMGMESNGMLLAVSGEDGPVLLVPERDTTPGVEVK